MLAGLAGVVHDRQRADSHEHNRDEDNDYGALHMMTSRPRPLTGRISLIQV